MVAASDCKIPVVAASDRKLQMSVIVNYKMPVMAGSDPCEWSQIINASDGASDGLLIMPVMAKVGWGLSQQRYETEKPCPLKIYRPHKCDSRWGIRKEQLVNALKRNKIHRKYNSSTQRRKRRNSLVNFHQTLQHAGCLRAEATENSPENRKR